MTVDSLRPSLRTLLPAAQAAIAARSRPPLTPEQRVARSWSLAQFTQHAWSTVEPGTPLIWSWHLSAISDHCQALHDGGLKVNNLAIAIPPGSGKSRLTSVMFPAWVWVRNPTWRGIFASCNPRVATRDSLLCRQLVCSPWYRSTFGISWDLAGDQDTKTLFGTDSGGWRMASTIGAKVIGDRGDFLGIDDPLDPADCFSRAAREEVVRWYSQSFAPRLADMTRGKRLLISQRLDCEDLLGWLVATEPQAWETLVIPMEFELARRCVTSIWSDPRNVDGELMFPERFPPEVVAAEKVRLGRSGYAGQMQQSPFASGGEMFKPDDLQLLDAVPECSQTVISVDSAFKNGQENDYSVAVVLGQFERGVVILDVVRGKWLYPRLKATLVELAARVHPMAVLVEDAASGQSLLQDLQTQSTLPLVPVKVSTDKLSRAHAALPTWESHRVHAIKGAVWLPALLDELVSFPKGVNDDQVDALTQGLHYLSAGPGQGLLDWYRTEVAKQQTVTAASTTGWPQPARSMAERVRSDGVATTDLTPWH